MSTFDFINGVKDRAKSILSEAFEFLGEEIFLPAIYVKRDVVKVKLRKVRVESSDSIGVGRQLKIKIEGLEELTYDPTYDLTGYGALAYPDKPILVISESDTVNFDVSDKDLFFLETKPVPISGYPRVSNPDSFKVTLKVTIDEDDPTYDDHSLFTTTHYIPYQNKYSYLEDFSITHITNFYEGPIRKDVNVKFLFDFEFNMIQAVDEIEIVIYLLRGYIKDATDSYAGVSPGLVAAILYDELYHRDILDDWQDGSNPFTLVDQIFINRSGEANTFVGREELPDLDVTLGFGQVSINGVKSRVAMGHIDASSIPGYRENPDEAAMKFLLDPRTAPIIVAATLYHLFSFINSNNGGAWNSHDYPQAVAYFYSSGYGPNGEILQNPADGNEKIQRIERLENVLSFQ